MKKVSYILICCFLISLCPFIKVTGKETELLIFSRDAKNKLGQERKALYVINSDGTGLRQILPATYVRDSSVSPLGKKIAYTDGFHIHICDWDGSNDLDITSIPREHYQPRWSPDGKLLLFASDRLGNSEIFLMHPDGSDAFNISWHMDSLDISPAWSPDGSNIVFISDRKGVFDLFVSDIKGVNQRKITDSLHNCREPAWSPDGKWIAFSSDKEKPMHLFLIKPDGSELKQLTTGSSWNGLPSWNADSKRIAFISDRDGNPDIFIINIEDLSLQNITRTPDVEESYPAWVPVQKEKRPLDIKQANISNIELPRPRLLFTSNDIPALLEKFSKPPFDEAWSNFLKRCDGLTDSSNRNYRQVELSIAAISSNLDRSAAWIPAVRDLGFAYQLTKNDKYGLQGKNWLSESAKKLSIYYGNCLGLWTVDVNHFCWAFDWLYPLLNDEEKAPILTVLKLSALSTFLYALNSPEMLSQRAMQYQRTCNFSMFSGPFLGMMALALIGEKEYDPIYLSAAQRMIQNLAFWWFDENGACKEWRTYFTWSSDAGAPFFATAQKYNLLPFLSDSPMSKWPYWMVMASAEQVNWMMAFGDDNAGPSRVSLPYLEVFKNNKLLELLWANSPNAKKPPRPDVIDLLFWHQPEPDYSILKSLPRSEIFVEPGFAIMRASWQSNAPVMAISAPRVGGHLHADAGSIQLSAYGDYLLIDLGYGAGEAIAANNVLINGKGRGHPPLPADIPLFTNFTKSSFVDGMQVNLKEMFKERIESHFSHNHIPLPHFPLSKGIRTILMVAEPSEKVPPYFVLYDDLEKQGTTNLYTSQFYVKRDVWFKFSTNEVITTPLYTGKYLTKSDPTSSLPFKIEFSFDVNQDAEYYIWLFANKNQAGISIDKTNITGSTFPEVPSSTLWQWQSLMKTEGTNRVFVSTSLSKGKHKLVIQNYNFAKIMLTPEKDISPWMPEAPEIKNKILLNAEDASITGNISLLNFKNNPSALRFLWISPDNLEFTPDFYSFRTVHYGKILVKFPKLVASARTTNPRFLTILYPFLPEMEQPVLEKFPTKEGLIIACLKWKQATDWIIVNDEKRAVNIKEPLAIETDAYLAIIRKHKDGTILKYTLDGSYLKLIK
jgi:TolB protein